MAEEINLQEVKDAIASIQNAQTEFQDSVKQKLDAKGSPDPLIEEKLQRIEADLADSRKLIDQAALAQKRQANVIKDDKGNIVDLDEKAASWANGIARRAQRVAPEGFGREQEAAYKSAFNTLVRKEGDGRLLGADELKALSVGSDPDGGYFVPDDMSGRIVRQVYETSPMRAYASIVMTSRDSITGMYDNDEAGAEWEGELTSATETDTPQVGQWNIPVHHLRAMPKSSQQMLDDADFNVEAWLADKVASRFARKENSAFVSGNGVSKPRGFLDYPDGTDLTNSIERIKTGVNGAFAADPDGVKKLLEAMYKLKAQYRANMGWFMNSGTTSVLRQLQDNDGRFLWQDSVAAGQPSTFLGYSVAAFEDMPDIATGSLSIALGDMRQAYQVVDRAGISTLRDPYTAKPNVLFYTRKRTGGDMINGEALKLIEFSA